MEKGRGEPQPNTWPCEANRRRFSLDPTDCANAFAQSDNCPLQVAALLVATLAVDLAPWYLAAMACGNSSGPQPKATARDAAKLLNCATQHKCACAWSNAEVCACMRQVWVDASRSSERQWERV